MGIQTALYQQHLDQGAKMVDFGGWDMPLHYGSQLHEHREVRTHVGVFDVSHMVVVDVWGAGVTSYLRTLLANDVATLQEASGRALYSAMLNEEGGVIDDLIVYAWGQGYRLVLNCANGAKDLQWMQKVAKDFMVTIEPQQNLALLALQGPKAEETLRQLLPAGSDTIPGLPTFHCAQIEDCFVGRTGYTGEDGFEIAVANERAPDLWRALMKLKVQPCGLGARDTLRIEAGLNLYGHEMDEQVSPLEANMAWTVAWEPAERNFIGREALQRQRDSGGSRNKLVGLVLEERGVLRSQQIVHISEHGNLAEAASGIVTSGTFSPTLGKSIALARVPNSVGPSCWVELRNRLAPVRVVPPRFVRHGQSLVD